VLASSSSTAAASSISIVAFVIAVLYIAGMWQIFRKAGRPGWAAIVPFYDLYVLLKVVGRPGWWLVLYFIPLVNIVISLIVLWDLCRSFGKGWGFWWGLFLLPFVFVPVLGFGSTAYIAPAADYDARDAAGRYMNPA